MKQKSKRTNGKSTCGFCGNRFRTTKARFKHAKDCKETKR